MAILTILLLAVVNHIALISSVGASDRLTEHRLQLQGTVKLLGDANSGPERVSGYFRLNREWVIPLLCSICKHDDTGMSRRSKPRPQSMCRVDIERKIPDTATRQCRVGICVRLCFVKGLLMRHYPFCALRCVCVQGFVSKRQ